MKHLILKTFILLTLIASATAALAQDPLPSWNDSASKSAIIEFVSQVTSPNSPGYVPAPERIATFDNDGTLWSEQPMYFQIFFALSQIKNMAPDHPEWQTTEPFKSALADDMKGVMATGKAGLMKLLAAAHSGMTAPEFAEQVNQWATTAEHPTKDVLFTDLVYQPMLELLYYLRDNEFKTYIVSGGGVDFMRVFTERVYGIPPEQVVGTTPGVKFEMVNGIPTIMKESNIVLIDDKDGKPVGIYRFIGRRPIFAAGNSDGDQAMLEYTTISDGADDTTPRFGMLVHHTDAVREWAYDRDSHIGTLNTALDAATQQGWMVVDMKNDWKVIYPVAMR
jgi:phosphoglycolate phosphatase-like HAD superfamily hydrolase